MKLTPNWNKEEDHNEERGTSLIGRIVYFHMQEPMKDLGYALSTAHIIGWRVDKNKNQPEYYTFTSLSDGMTNCYTLDELISMLNKQPYVPIPSSVLTAMMLEKQPLS